MITDISLVPVEQWSIADVKPYPFNNKKHPPKHIELLKKSIKVHGLLDPVVVQKSSGYIISGHGRREGCAALDMDKVAVRVLDVSDEIASALRIAANKTVSNEYDTDMLSRELRALSEAEVDLSALGFDEKELSMLISDVGEIDTDSLVLDMDMEDAVLAHEEGIDASAEAADTSEVRLDKAFGFKTIPLRDQKTVTRFMAEMEARTGKPGMAGLITHMQEMLTEW